MLGKERGVNLLGIYCRIVQHRRTKWIILNYVCSIPPLSPPELCANRDVK